MDAIAAANAVHEERLEVASAAESALVPGYCVRTAGPEHGDQQGVGVRRSTTAAVVPVPR